MSSGRTQSCTNWIRRKLNQAQSSCSAETSHSRPLKCCTCVGSDLVTWPSFWIVKAKQRSPLSPFHLSRVLNPAAPPGLFSFRGPTIKFVSSRQPHIIHWDGRQHSYSIVLQTGLDVITVSTSSQLCIMYNYIHAVMYNMDQDPAGLATSRWKDSQ